MKTLYGKWDRDRCGIWVNEGAGGGGSPQFWPPGTELPACPELFKGQVLPFNWGADGPGTAHAAAAILLQVLGRNPAPTAVKAVFPLLRRFLAALPAEDFELSEPFLLALLQAACETQAPATAGAH